MTMLHQGHVSMMNLDYFAAILKALLSVAIGRFQFDQMLFNRIAGRKNVGSGLGNSFHNMMATSTFGPKYWRGKTNCVIDMIRQFGVDSLYFMTISPYEWTWPWAEAVRRARDRRQGQGGLTCKCMCLLKKT